MTMIGACMFADCVMLTRLTYTLLSLILSTAAFSVYNDIYNDHYSLFISDLSNLSNHDTLTFNWNNKQFLCAVSDKPTKITHSTQLSTAISSLEQLKSNCLFYQHGWWTYEFCLEKHIRQFHRYSLLTNNSCRMDQIEYSQFQKLSHEKQLKKISEIDFYLARYKNNEIAYSIADELDTPPFDPTVKVPLNH